MPSHRLDPMVRRVGGGRTLIGGSPFRVLRLSPQQARHLDRMLDGEVDDTAADDTAELDGFAEDLIRHGMVHPEPSPNDDPFTPAMVDVVIPCRDHGASLPSLIARLADLGLASITVVDDGSRSPVVVAHEAVTVLRNATPLGPAAARQRGWLTGMAPLVAFIDADVTVPDGATAPDWLSPLLAWFGAHVAPSVGAVAPRIRIDPGRNGRTHLARYEATRSPLDLGSVGGPVAPSTRVSYVPGGMQVIRRDALVEVDGFDTTLHRGEDVDVIWRLVAAGWMVRYEPSVVVHHPPPRSWSGLVEQRIGYGRGATDLALRHPGSVTPLEASPWSVATWVLVASGSRWATAAGVTVGVGSTIGLAPHLEDRVDAPLREAIRLAGGGNLAVGPLLSTALRRAWLPFAIPVLASRHWRRVVALATIAPLVAEWWTQRTDPGNRPGERSPLLVWLASRTLDDVAGCLGVWWGVAEGRSLRAVRPRFPPLSQLIPPAPGSSGPQH